MSVLPLPADVPSLEQSGLPLALGPQRKKSTVPCASAGAVAPVTLIVARSWTCWPGVTMRVLSSPCTAVDKAGAQVPNFPVTKSFRVAVVEVEERVSDTIVEKHSPVRLRSDRLRPASKNSPFRAPLFGVLLLSVNDHGIVMVIGFTSPQAMSLFGAVVQLAGGPVRFAINLRLASPQLASGLLVAVQAGSHL